MGCAGGWGATPAVRRWPPGWVKGSLDRALADRGWLRERLAEVESGRPMRAVQWGKAALVWADLHVCWALTEDREEALALERRALWAGDGTAAPDGLCAVRFIAPRPGKTPAPGPPSPHHAGLSERTPTLCWS